MALEPHTTQARSEPSVDVIVPSFNAGAMVSACVERLLADPAVARVIVVDDASTDGTPERLREQFPAVSVLALERHQGLAFAMNRGWERGSAELVLFLNDDVIAAPGAVTTLADAFREVPGAASAGGRLVDPGSTRTQLTYSPRQIPGLAGLLVRIVGVERHWPRNPWTGAHLTDPLDESRRQVTDRQPAGACLLVGRDVLQRIGGWDERYWLWYEDVDISRRLLELGPALYVPDAVFEHVGRASTRAWERYEQHRRLYHGTMVYAQSHLDAARQRALAATMVVVCAVRMLLALPRDRRAAHAYWELIGSAGAMLRLRAVTLPRQDLARPGVDR